MDDFNLSRRRHPAGRSLVTASVVWSDRTAMLEIVNRHGRIVEFIVEGVAAGRRRIRVGGNDRFVILYDVPPAERLVVSVDDGSGRILYAGSPD